MSDHDSTPLMQQARGHLEVQLQGLQRVIDQLGPEICHAVEILETTLSHGGRLVICGMGKSYHIGKKLCATFNSLGMPCSTMHAAEARHGDLGMLAQGDAVILLSFSGESEEILHILPHVKKLASCLVALTGSNHSSLAENADVVIDLPIEQEACVFGLAPTTSSLVTLALGDTLSMLLAERRGFQREEFAKLHPSGAIGNTLGLLRDIMRTDGRFAKTEAETSLQDTLLLMTNCRSGAAAITDSQGVLCGIVTDGDIRRHFLKGDALLDLPIKEIMTPSPLSLKESDPISDALSFFQTHSIDDIIIVDAEQRPVGMLDLQDIPKLKLMRPSS